MTNDTLSDMLTRIRNAVRVKSSMVEVPKTRMTSAVAAVLVREGFLESAQPTTVNGRALLTLRLKYRANSLPQGRLPVLTNLQRLSRPGLRVYAAHQEIPQILGGLGLVILSTPQGVITDREARVRRLGGELLCSIW